MLTSNKIKKIIFLGLFFLSLCISIFSFTIVSKAQAQCAPGTVFYNNACIPTYLYNQIYQSSNSSTTLTNQNTPYNKSVYEPLAKLPGLGNFKFDDPCPLGRYLNIVINLIIGLIAVMAMVTIVMGGLQYITSELVSGKADGKGKILNAIFGLLIALSSYLVLNTLNPNLLNLCLDGIPKVQFNTDSEPEAGIGGGKKGEQVTIKDKDGNDKKITACDQSQMQTISVFGTSVTVYKDLAPGLQRINQQWLAKPASQRYQIKSIGGYNCRTVSGKNAWSSHAFGTALDINPATNPYGKEYETDMPAWFINLFKAEGYGWGGDWSSVKDTMHFSKVPPIEGGNGKVGP